MEVYCNYGLFINVYGKSGLSKGMVIVVINVISSTSTDIWKKTQTVQVGL